MLKLSKKMLFAIEAVLDIAYHAGDKPVQNREITRRQKIPRRYLEQALQQLVRHGVLIGVRGPGGGYLLARERRRISIGDIVRVVHDTEVDDGLSQDVGLSELGIRVVRPMWVKLQANILNELDKISIDDLCDNAAKIDIVSEGQTNMDFSI
jgi:Rrf2 family transcriptional regulator, iron-sulfur cluster assembly transcription factor